MSYYNNGSAYPVVKKNEDDDRKLFVGALKWETSKEDLQQYFEQFGEVTYANVKTDPNSGKSRGFGFVTFADEASVVKVVQQKHEIDGKTVDAKRAKSRNMPDYGPICKIFVGGLDPNMPEETIKEYFGQFGNIVEMNHPHDRKKNQKKGFCFIRFEKPDIVHNIVGNKEAAKHSLVGSEVDVKRAIDRQGGYQDAWGQAGWGAYGQEGGWGQSRGAAGGGRDRYDSGRGWGGDQGYYGGGGGGGGGYGAGSYGNHGGYDSYGGGHQGGYYSQQSNYQSYGNGYD